MIPSAVAPAAAVAGVAFWAHETLEAPIVDGVDEIALALSADAWGRSMRTRVVTTHPGHTVVHARHGLTILPDAAPQRGGHIMPAMRETSAAQLEATFSDMRRRYGVGAERLASLGMEAPSRAAHPR